MFAIFPHTGRRTETVEDVRIVSGGLLPTFCARDAEMHCGHRISLFQTFLCAQFTNGFSSERNSVSQRPLLPYSHTHLSQLVNCSATCVYLSCKTEEFNVSIDQFVHNIKGDQKKAMDIILSNELLLMQQLNYYLTIHNPYRPVEGFLIDIKTRCKLTNPDRLRPGIDEFLEKTFLTDACLLYSPSQLALAAVLKSASKEQENLDSYVTDSLFFNAHDQLANLVPAVRSKLIAVTGSNSFQTIFLIGIHVNRNS